MLVEPSKHEDLMESSIPISDKELVSRILEGEIERYQDLVNRHQSMVFVMIARRVRDRETSEELAQDVFLRAYQGLARFRGDARFETWLVRIVLNVTNSYFSSKRYKQRLRSVKFEPTEHEANTNSVHPVERRQELEGFARAIVALKPKLREVITLCALEGRPYVEVAEILKIPVGTVRSRLNTARLALRGSLREVEA